MKFGSLFYLALGLLAASTKPCLAGPAINSRMAIARTSGSTSFLKMKFTYPQGEAEVSAGYRSFLRSGPLAKRDPEHGRGGPLRGLSLAYRFNLMQGCFNRSRRTN